MSYALTDLITEEEVLLFPFDSLVSEFEGALGLFLVLRRSLNHANMGSWLGLVWSRSRLPKVKREFCQTGDTKASARVVKMAYLPLKA